MTTSIRLGALTLIGEPCCSDSRCDRTIVTGFPGGDEANLRGDAWQSLANVAAIVEAAKEWREGVRRDQRDVVMRDESRALMQAIDSLNATRDGGK